MDFVPDPTLLENIVVVHLESMPFVLGFYCLSIIGCIFFAFKKSHAMAIIVGQVLPLVTCLVVIWLWIRSSTQALWTGLSTMSKDVVALYFDELKLIVAVGIAVTLLNIVLHITTNIVCSFKREKRGPRGA